MEDGKKTRALDVISDSLHLLCSEESDPEQRSSQTRLNEYGTTDMLFRFFRTNYCTFMRTELIECWVELCAMFFLLFQKTRSGHFRQFYLRVNNALNFLFEGTLWCVNKKSSII